MIHIPLHTGIQKSMDDRFPLKVRFPVSSTVLTHVNNNSPVFFGYIASVRKIPIRSQCIQSARLWVFDLTCEVTG